MGNRATVIFTDGKKEFSPAVYLHWNGGPESIYGFLDELNRRKVRADQNYECARFVQLVGEFFDQNMQGTTSLGIANGPRSDSLTDLQKVRTDHSDNGFYLVSRTNGEMNVRRFTEKMSGDWEKPSTVNFYFAEWAPEEVAQEKRLAYKHEYNKTFKDEFVKIANGRDTDKYA
jgi:hypothetical protein